MQLKKTKKEVLALLEKNQDMIVKKNLRAIPGNYAELQYAVKLKELEYHTPKLQHLFSLDTNHSEDFLKLSFLELCKIRNTENHNTSLCYSAIPESITNQLYFAIAEKLFSPKNFQQLLSLLMPNITHVLTITESEELLPKTTPSNTLDPDRVQLALSLQPLEKLSIYPAQLSMFTQCVLGDDLVFLLNNIENYSLPIHNKVHKLLAIYPTIQEKIYTHNDDLKELSFDIALMEKNGLTPNDVLTQFCNELILSGTRYTGSTHASSCAEKACLSFQSYLDQLPAELCKKILATSPATKNDSLKKILKKHLAAGECVEEAATRIRMIQENPKNADILKTRPNLTEQQFITLKKKYHKSISVAGFNSTKSLPDTLKEIVFKSVQIASTHDYIDILLNLPASEYLVFLKYATITADPALPSNLGSALKMLQKEQIDAFYNALIILQKQFGGLYPILLFCINNNIISVVETLLRPLDSAAVFELMITHLPQTLKMNLRSNITLFENTLEHSDDLLFHAFWSKLNQNHRLMIFKDADSRGINLIGKAAACKHRSAFLSFWEFSKEYCLSKMNQRSSWGSTFLHFLSTNKKHDVFIELFKFLPVEMVESQIKMKTHFGETPITSAILASNTSTFKVLWDTQSTDEKLVQLIPNAYQIGTVLNLVAQNLDADCVLQLLDILPEKNKVNEFKRQNNVLDSLAMNKDSTQFVKFWNSLTETYQSLVLKRCFTTTIMHNLAIAENYLGFNIVLNSLTKESQLKFLLEKNSNKKSPLYEVIDQNNVEQFHIIWLLIPEKKRLSLLKKKRNGDSLIQKLIEHKRWQIFNALLNYPETQHILLNDAYAMATLALQSNSKEISKIILNWLFSQEVLFTLEEKMKLIIFSLSLYDPETFFIIWSSVAENEKVSFKIIVDPDSNYNLLQQAALQSHPDVWSTVWRAFSNLDYLSAIHNDTQPLLVLALKHNHIVTHTFKTVLEFLPPEERRAHLEKHQILKTACLDFKHDHIRVILQCLLPEERNEIILKSGLIKWALQKTNSNFIQYIVSVILDNKNSYDFPEMVQDLMLVLDWAISENNEEIFYSIFDFLPQDANNTTILHKVVKHNFIKGFCAIWNSLSPREQMDEIERRDSQNYSLLHSAAELPNSYIFLTLYRTLNKSNQLKMLMDKNGDHTILRSLIDKNAGAAIRIICNEFSQTKELTQIIACSKEALVSLVQKKDESYFFTIWNNLTKNGKKITLRKKGDPFWLLHQASYDSSVKVWDTIWNFYSIDKQKAVCLKSETSFLQKLLSSAFIKQNFYALEFLLNTIPEPDRLAFMLKKIEHIGVSYLEHAIKCNSDLFFLFLKLLPSTDKRILLTLKTSTGCNILFDAVKSKQFTMWEFLWNLCSKEEQLAAAQEQDPKDQTTLLHHFILSYNLIALKNFLNSFSNSEKIELILGKNRTNMMFLNMAVNSNKHHVLALLFNALSESDPSNSIQTLQHACYPGDIQKNLSGTALIVNLVRKKNIVGNTFIHLLVLNTKHDALEVVLNFLPQKLRLSSLTDKNIAGISPLHFAVTVNSSKTWFTCMNFLSRKERILAANVEDMCGHTPIYLAAKRKDPQVLFDILKSYPKSERMNMIKRLQTDREKAGLPAYDFKHRDAVSVEARLISKFGLFSTSVRFDIDDQMLTPLQSRLLEGFEPRSFDV